MRRSATTAGRVSGLAAERPTLNVQLINLIAAVAVCLACPAAWAELIMPTGVGTRWEYELRDGARQQQMTVEIAGTEEFNNLELLKLDTSVGGALIKSELIAVDELGARCYRRSYAEGEPATFDPPQTIAKAPLEVGESWPVADRFLGAEVRGEFKVAAVEDVIVPAGTFRAFHLHCEQPWPVAVTVERWFAPGTGVVKEITTTRGPSGRLLGRATLELKQLVAAPPAAPAPSAIPETPSITIDAAATPPPTATASATEAATPEPTIAATPAQPAILLEVSGERDGAAQTEFRSDAPNIYVRWRGENLSPGSVVRVVWIAEDVGDVADPNFVVDETETVVTERTFGARFTLSRPRDGWAAGKYRLELYLDGVLTATSRVTIRD